MKIKEFVNTYKKSNVKSLDKTIATKKYLPYAEKEMLVNSILNQCKVEDNGFIKFDETKQYIIFTTEVIKAYTNLEFDAEYDFMLDEYDELCENDMLSDIIETFDGEYKIVLNMLNMKQEYMLQDNSIEHQMASFLSGLTGIIDGLVGAFTSKVEAFDAIDNEKIDELNGLLKSLK